MLSSFVRNARLILVSTFVWATWCSVPAVVAEDRPLPAFVGAEGFGAKSVGGRGGCVIHVTNLNSSGPGSLQAACDADGPRIVVFDVSGVIRSDVIIRNSRITIAGQSAPSSGITIEGRLLRDEAAESRLTDVIVRFIRFRPRPVVGVEGDAVTLMHTERLILDHLSLSWANDETIDICHSSDVTVQWCTIEEADVTGHPKGLHNWGFLCVEPGSGNISIHHNLFAHLSERNPAIAPYEHNKPADVRNNVIYNFRGGVNHAGHKPVSPINIVNNYFKRGPSSSQITPVVAIDEAEYFRSGNFVEGYGDIDSQRENSAQLPKWLRIRRHGVTRSEPALVASVSTDDAPHAYERVLQLAGCFPRDRVTRQTIRDVQNGGGEWGRHAPDKPTAEWFLEDLEVAKLEKDSDGDGIPDAWELTHDLNPFDGADSSAIQASGYPAIEEYLNNRAEALLRSTPL